MQATDTHTTSIAECQHYSALQFEASPRIWAVRPSLLRVGSGQPEFLMDRG